MKVYSYVFCLLMFLAVNNANAAIIDDKTVQSTNEQLSKSLDSYDDVVSIQKDLKKQVDENKALKDQISKLEGQISDYEKSKEQKNSDNTNVQKVLDILKEPPFLDDYIDYPDYLKAKVSLEANDVSLAENYLISITNVNSSGNNIDGLLSVQSIANLVLGYIYYDIHKDLPKALSYFSAAYTIANTSDTSLISLSMIVSIFKQLGKEKEMCITYANYQDTIKVIHQQNLPYNQKLINKELIDSIASICITSTMKGNKLDLNVKARSDSTVKDNATSILDSVNTKEKLSVSNDLINSNSGQSADPDVKSNKEDTKENHNISKNVVSSKNSDDE